MNDNLRISEFSKIPDICDEFIKKCNCKWKSEGDFHGDYFYTLPFGNYKLCPKICPNYKKEIK